MQARHHEEDTGPGLEPGLRGGCLWGGAGSALAMGFGYQIQDRMSTLAQWILKRILHTDPTPKLFVQRQKQWQGQSWAQAGAQLQHISTGLYHLGLHPGERVAIIGDPDPFWILYDFATLLNGAITVGIYPTLTAAQTAYQLQHSQACIVIVGDDQQLDKITSIKAQLPALRHLLRWDWEPPSAALNHWPDVQKRAQNVQSTDIASLVYTSGTTGPPKAAMLSHGALCQVCEGTQRLLPLSQGERSICFLPLAHVLQRIGVYRALIEDIAAYFCQRFDEVPATLPIAQPSLLLAVPRMLEKIKAGIEKQVSQQSPLRQRIFYQALAIGHQRSLALEQGQMLSLSLRIKWRFAQRVFDKVQTRLGGRLKLFACGGAALAPDVARFFHAMGIDVLEGWGLTETCAPATMNTLQNFRFGTVGKVLPNTEIRLATDGEIWVRGPGLFSGYWNNPDATADVFEDGWFKTGDIGAWDDGFLKIIDRKKELIITSGGKNIAPLPLEQRLKIAPIGQAIVIGDHRPYLVALLAPDPEGQPPTDAEKARIDEHIQAINTTLAPFEQLKAWAWLPETLTVENGLLTPTQKIRRRPIAERYAPLIETLYNRNNALSSAKS